MNKMALPTVSLAVAIVISTTAVVLSVDAESTTEFDQQNIGYKYADGVLTFYNNTDATVSFPEPTYDEEKKQYTVEYDVYKSDTTKVVIGNFSNVGRFAFSGFTSLTEVTLSSSVTTISSNAFSGCTALKSIDLSNVTAIRNEAFRECSSLTIQTLPSGLTTVGGNAFNGVSIPGEVVIPEGVTEIIAYSFAGIKGVTGITIPETVKTIDSGAFTDCTSLKTVTFEGENPPMMKSNNSLNTSTDVTFNVPETAEDLYVDTINGSTSETPTIETKPLYDLSDYSWYQDEGTIVLHNEGELMEFADLVNKGCGFEGRTIQLEEKEYDISGIEWEPIGITAMIGDEIMDRPFQGTLDGNGATIVGLTMTSEDTDKPSYRGMDGGNYHVYGFFGGVVGGSVTGLSFEEYTINSPGVDSANNVVAVAVGSLLFEGTVSDIYVGEGEVNAISRGAGVVGYIGGANTATDKDHVIGPAYVEGIHMGTITVSDNENHADVFSNYTGASNGTAGGIISTTNLKMMAGGTYMITDNTNYGDMTGWMSAGIVASDFSYTTDKIVSGNTNRGDIRNHDNLGAGDAAGIMVHQTAENKNVGDFTLQNNANYGNVTSTDGSASGIVGTVYSTAVISGNTNGGDVSGYLVASGIVTGLNGGQVNGNTNSGNIVLTISDNDMSASNSAGGIVANVGGGTVGEGNENTGAVNGNGENIGNIVGRITHGTLPSIEDGDLGAIQMVGGGDHTTSIGQSTLTSLKVASGHNQFYEYTVDLNGSSIGLVTASGYIHTGMNLKLVDGDVTTMNVSVAEGRDDKDDDDSPTVSIVLHGTDVGRLDASFASDGGRLRLAASEGDTLGYVTCNMAVDIGVRLSDGSDYSKEYPSEGTIGYVISDVSVRLNTALTDAGSKPEYAVYSGADLSAYKNGATSDTGLIGYVDASCFENGSVTSDPGFDSDIGIFVPAGFRMNLGTTITSTIFGFDGTSILELVGEATAGNLTAGVYVWGGTVWVGDSYIAVIGEDGYMTLYDALSSAQDGETVTLLGDTTMVESVVIGEDKSIKLDLGDSGYEVFLPKDIHIIVEGGSLEVTGSGSLRTEATSTAPIVVRGSTDVSASDYSVLTVGADVTLSGYWGLSIQETKNQTNFYGMRVEFYGKAVGLTDYSANGYHGGGLYVSGNICKTEGKVPIINVHPGAEITGTGDALGIYAAGQAVWSIDGATISGSTGIEIRNGTMTIEDSVVTSTATSYETMLNGSGRTTIGAAVAVTSYYSEADHGTVTVSILSSEFEGPVAFSQANPNNTTSPKFVLSIGDGTFTSTVGDAVIAEEGMRFVSGGWFSSNVSVFCVEGYTCVESNGGYVPSYTGADGVAMVGDVVFQDFKEALDHADGDTVVLIADVEWDYDVPYVGDVSLDVSDAGITVTGSLGIVVDGDLSIVSSDVERTLNGNVVTTGSLTLENFVVNGTIGCVPIDSENTLSTGDVNVAGVTAQGISVGTTGSVSVRGLDIVGGEDTVAMFVVGGALLLEDCSFFVAVQVQSDDMIATNDLGAEKVVTIIGGTYLLGLTINAGYDTSTSIDGGVFGSPTVPSLTLTGAHSVRVVSGTFNGPVAMGSETLPFIGSILVEGGTFSGTEHPATGLPEPFGDDPVSTDTSVEGYVTYVFGDGHTETFRYVPSPVPPDPSDPGTDNPSTNPGWNNDDDDVPLPPVIVYEDDDSGDGDAVKVVACAAAAVVAALIAAYLIIDRKH